MPLPGHGPVMTRDNDWFTRRRVVALSAGLTAGLAGCGVPDGEDGEQEDDGEADGEEGGDGEDEAGEDEDGEDHEEEERLERNDRPRSGRERR